MKDESTTETTEPTVEKAAWTRGYAAALAVVIRMFDRPSMAVDIARMDGLKLADFTKAKVEDFDLAPIRKAFRENPR